MTIDVKNPTSSTASEVPQPGRVDTSGLSPERRLDAIADILVRGIVRVLIAEDAADSGAAGAPAPSPSPSSKSAPVEARPKPPRPPEPTRPPPATAQQASAPTVAKKSEPEVVAEDAHWFTEEQDALRKLPVAGLRLRWLDLFGEETTSRNKDYLIKRIAYRIQEKRYGGLTPRALARIELLARDAPIRRRLPPTRPGAEVGTRPKAKGQKPRR